MPEKEKKNGANLTVSGCDFQNRGVYFPQERGTHILQYAGSFSASGGKLLRGASSDTGHRNRASPEICRYPQPMGLFCA
ncbi:MAG TPA: hypothetical protein IAA54_09610 [Candidatus Gallacutalibacter pullicola]|uniref:Uncharacterized protein n=1 Tax=Candidatus Gallacutalibacter pullicola TaxID=2840830 RepID=A0A9D1DRS9_9FIRM|nr:hypothetical protein [Candidatus Gallacutalibacter pullicola]